MKGLLLLSLCLTVAPTACSSADETSEPATSPVEQPSLAPASPTAPDLPPAAPEADANTIGQAPTLHYQCGDLLVMVRKQRQEVRLSFSGRDITLPHAPSGSGDKYDDGKDNAFWSKSDESMLTLDGKEATCTRSERTSPWVDAQTRGIGFRAVGSEPGWYVEVGRGEAPALHAQLDYGERTIDIASARPLTGDLTGFRGTATDGTAIELRIRSTPCSDGMSGEAFEASAELLVADKPYKGCGAYL